MRPSQNVAVMHPALDGAVSEPDCVVSVNMGRGERARSGKIYSAVLPGFSGFHQNIRAPQSIRQFQNVLIPVVSTGKTTVASPIPSSVGIVE